MNKTYDVIIIGAGPGGYAAAIRAAELGLKACIIERELIGGTCLNWGCIPTKTIARSIDCIRDIMHAEKFGIKVKSYNTNFAAILSRKDTVVNTLRAGAESMLRIKKVDIVKSEAVFISPKKIKVGDDILESGNIVIATGSMPAELKSLKFDRKNILSSRDILSLGNLPKSLVVVGGGFIGCEFASIYSRLGVDVTIVEISDQLIPGTDKEIAGNLERVFLKNGIKIFKKDSVVSARNDNGIFLKLQSAAEIGCDKVLLCVGRRPDIENLNLESAGVEVEKGFIRVDDNLRTSVSNIYAIGDVIAGYPLAHVAAYEGTLAVDNIAGKNRKADYRAVPSAVFTYPEIATVGKSIEQFKDKSSDVKEIKLPFAAVSKAHVYGETDGLVKFIFEIKTRKILGASIIGPYASEIISSFTIAVKNGLTVDDLSHTIFTHPTFSECVLDAVNRARYRV
jgi:dihydrolipoamide dehydrogenase